MVLSRPFQFPTRVHVTESYAEAVARLLGGRSWALATSGGWVARGAVDALARSAGAPAAVIDAIPQNPKASDILNLSGALPKGAEVVVALGGGSVIDCAKALVGFTAIGRDQAILMAHLKNGSRLPDSFVPRPIIAVPTTSGTGSEVTPWATIWGDDKVKFSFTHPALYPSEAVLDPVLCTSMPPEVTLASGLDALSHACEAIWNNHHVGISDELAQSAIRSLKRTLPRAMAEPMDLAARAEVQTAALLAGLAMGTTQTALAHSISYPFTAKFGMPHGLACSFTLPEVARYNAEQDGARVGLAAEAFGTTTRAFPDALADWLDKLGIGVYLERYVAPDVTDTLGDDLITRARAANNLREVDGAVARALARFSLERFCRRVCRAAV
jgi:alcohol dehydrogenase